jgi:hypothetical protein
MNVLSPTTPMMIKKKTKDTKRKNVARTSVIMMTHPLCCQGEPCTERTESVPTTIPADAMKLPINGLTMSGEFYPHSHHYIVADSL